MRLRSSPGQQLLEEESKVSLCAETRTPVSYFPEVCLLQFKEGGENWIRGRESKTTKGRSERPKNKLSRLWQKNRKLDQKSKGVCKSSAEIFLSQNTDNALSLLSTLRINICLLRLVFKVQAWFMTNIYILLTTECNFTMNIVGWCLMWTVKSFGYKDSTEQHNMPSALHQPGYTARKILITIVNIKCIKTTVPYTIKFILTAQIYLPIIFTTSQTQNFFFLWSLIQIHLK